MAMILGQTDDCISRSRKGAWIEMCVTAAIAIRVMVAPVRERGLKYHHHGFYSLSFSVAPVRERGLK